MMHLLKNDSDFELLEFMNFRVNLSWTSLGFVIIGLIANMITFFCSIIIKKGKNVEIYLSFMAVSSFIALLGLMVFSVAYDLLASYGKIDKLDLLFPLYPYFYPIIAIFQMSSIIFTACYSVKKFQHVYEQYRKGVRSLLHQGKIGEEEVRELHGMNILFIYFISVILCSPFWFMFSYDEEIGLHETDLAHDPLFMRIVHFWIYVPVIFLMPFFTLIFTNICTIYSLILIKRKALQFQESESNGFEHDLACQSLASGVSPSHNKRANEPNDVCRSDTKLNEQKSVSIFQIVCASITILMLFLISQSPALLTRMFKIIKCSEIALNCTYSGVYQYGSFISKFFLIFFLSFNPLIHTFLSFRISRYLIVFSN
jgi:hypothetical protein